MHNHGLVAELNERLGERQGLDGVAQWSVSGVCEAAVSGGFPPPSPLPFAFDAVVGCRSDRWRGTYERAKASAKATDKNKSCAGERMLVSLAIGLDRGEREARHTLHGECLRRCLMCRFKKKGG